MRGQNAAKKPGLKEDYGLERGRGLVWGGMIPLLLSAPFK
jgi:hypothetical protein